MLTFEDCMGYADLDEGTVQALAEHEHLPVMVACEMAQALIHSKKGASTIRHLMEEDLLHAERQHRSDRVRQISIALARFNLTHPEPGADRQARIA